MTESLKSDLVTVTLPDGRELEVPRGSTIRDVAFLIGKGLGRVAVGGRVPGEERILDLRTPIEEDTALEIVTADSPDGLEVIRHSCAHILADAVTRLWPDARLAIGPPVEDGFYYDIDLEHKITPEDFAAIEKEMARIIAEDSEFERVVVNREEELRRARERNDVYKAELLEALPEDEEVTFYRHAGGAFEDLCRGPHVPSTGYVKAFKIMRVAGSYWRGDERNKMLQRIYGTAWWRKQDLKAHLERLAEAEKRDHRRLGRELGLFMMNPDVAPASPFFLPKGAVLYRLLKDYMRERYQERGYEEVITPQIYDVKLWHRSGHYDHYKDNMFFTRIDEREFAVKPMNCPGHTFIYANETRSYRDLPLRIADFGRLHRYERSGVTSGLTRVRTFCQDDAHIFCRPDQIEAEVGDLLEMISGVYETFGFGDVKIFLSTRPESSVGSDELWERAESSLRSALEGSGIPYEVNPGDGAFYGPKVDFVVRDALKREWQLGTVQLDFNMPERFGLTYVTSAGEEECPVMIHRAIYGSLERFIGILIEHTGGAFPLWLAPVQVRVLTINDSHEAHASAVIKQLRAAGFRVEEDFSNAKTGAKIRDARLQRIPFVLVIGDREVEAGTVAVRERPDKNLGGMSVEKFVALLQERQRSRT